MKELNESERNHTLSTNVFTTYYMPLGTPFNYSILDRCFPDDQELYLAFSGTWALGNAFVGSLGNLLTILALPYAAKKKRFNLQHHWMTTCFVIHLAFADLLYCMINLPMHAIQYFNQSFPWEKYGFLCPLLGSMTYSNALVEWYSLGLIAISKCIALLHPKAADRIFSSRNRKLIILCIWIYACGLNLMMCFPDIFKIGKFGFNCRVGKCSVVYFEEAKDTLPAIVAINYIIPGLSITISYALIWKHIRNCHTYVKAIGAEQIKDQIAEREFQVTKLLFLVCLSYIIFVVPMALVNTFQVGGRVYLAMLCLYWLQYSINFYIYAARSVQYRKAFVFFLKRFCQRRSDDNED